MDGDLCQQPHSLAIGRAAPRAPGPTLQAPAPGFHLARLTSRPVFMSSLLAFSQTAVGQSPQRHVAQAAPRARAMQGAMQLTEQEGQRQSAGAGPRAGIGIMPCLAPEPQGITAHRAHSSCVSLCYIRWTPHFRCGSRNPTPIPFNLRLNPRTQSPWPACHDSQSDTHTRNRHSGSERLSARRPSVRSARLHVTNNTHPPYPFHRTIPTPYTHFHRTAPTPNRT